MRSAVIALAVVAMSAAPVLAQPVPCAGVPGVDDRCESWTAVYDDPTVEVGSHQLEPRLAGSADGRRLFVSIIDQRKNVADPSASPADWTVLGYDGATGAQLWRTKHAGPGNYERPNAIATTRDGSTVIVTGGSYDAPLLTATDRSLLTIAYDGTTGAERWRVLSPGPVKDVGTALQLNADESVVYVMVNDASGGEVDAGIAAYAVDDGALLWRTPYRGRGLGKVDSPKAIALSPSGDLLYLAVESGGDADFDADYAVVAFATGGPTPGAIVWEARWDAGQEKSDRVSDLAVDVDGRVIVTGDSLRDAPTTKLDYVTVAFDGRDGRELWSRRYTGTTGGPESGHHFGRVVAASPTSRVVVVSGQSQDATSDSDWATIAYDSATGVPLWTKRLSTPRAPTEFATDLVFTPDGSSVVGTGVSGGGNPTAYRDLNRSSGVTVAYRASDGALLWSARLVGDDEPDSFSPRTVITDSSGSAYTAGQLTNNLQTDYSDNLYDGLLVAYREDGGAEPVVPEGQPWLIGLAATAIAAVVVLRRRRVGTS